MPEDAPGNPGAERSAAPPARQVAVYRKVREMQAKLHRWAGEDSSRRFDDLFNLVYDLEFLAEAWLRVKETKGHRRRGSMGPRWLTSRTGSGWGCSWKESGIR